MVNVSVETRVVKSAVSKAVTWEVVLVDKMACSRGKKRVVSKAFLKVAK